MLVTIGAATANAARNSGRTLKTPKLLENSIISQNRPRKPRPSSNPRKKEEHETSRPPRHPNPRT